MYGSISGFGQDGPLADRGAVDQVIQGMAGLMSLTGEPGTPPTRVGIAIADMAAGELLATGVLLALLERARSGRGQWVQVSLLEALLSMLDFQAARWTVDGEVPGQAGNHHPTIAPMGTFRAADGYLNVAAPNNGSGSGCATRSGGRAPWTPPTSPASPVAGPTRARLTEVLEAEFSRYPRSELASCLRPRTCRAAR